MIALLKVDLTIYHLIAVQKRFSCSYRNYVHTYNTGTHLLQLWLHVFTEKHWKQKAIKQ